MSNSKKNPIAVLFKVVGALVGIYFTFSGLVYIRYSHYLNPLIAEADRLEDRLRKAADTSDIRKYRLAVGEIPRIQNKKCPPQPDFIKLKSIWRSLVYKERHTETVKRFQRILSHPTWRGWLANTSLNSVQLNGDVYLSEGSFKGANLAGANFQGATLHCVDFENANLKGANFDGAVLSSAFLKGVKGIVPEQIARTKTLWKASIDCDLEAKIWEIKPEVLKEPNFSKQLDACRRMIKSQPCPEKKSNP